MSSEGENTKDLSSAEVSKTSIDSVDGNSSEDSQDKAVKKVEKADEKNGEKSEAGLKSKDEKSSEDAAESKDKKESELKTEENGEDETKSEEKDKKNEKGDPKTDNDTEDGEGEDSGKEDGSSKKESKKGGVPLLDQPLEQSGTRERKKVQRFNDDGFVASDNKEGKTEFSDGAGVQLGEIPRIDASISRFKNDDLKLLHRLLFKTPGKTALIKKNIKKFNGFDFKKDSEEYDRKIDSTKKFEIKQLKSICEMLDLDKKGAKDEIVQRVIDFLLEPKDSGKPAGGGRPKRTAAVRANNRGYSSHDDSYSSDERRASRGGRGKGKRTNLKDDTTSESDEEFHPSDASESRPRVIKAKKVGRKKAADSEEEEEDEEEEDGSEVDSPTSDDSDDEPRKRKKSKKVVSNNKTKAKTLPKTRGRKPAAESEKKAPTPAKKSNRKRDRDSSEESEAKADDNDASSSEDEPLIKKAKSPEPPTDEEIKKYVKEILDGANLEEITMKTVCKQVYAHYPDFDLAHKKDFIKSTVKSLIST